MTTIPFPFGPCRICNAKSTGIHYGVATCEGCKGFFKRSIGRSEKYKCYFGGECVISPDNRNRCKSCRFKKCLQTGMAIEAVKMGRIPKVDRERAIQNLQQQQQQNMLRSEAGIWPDPNSTTHKTGEHTSDYESNESGSDNGDINNDIMRLKKLKNMPMCVSDNMSQNVDISGHILRNLLDTVVNQQNNHINNIYERTSNPVIQKSMNLDPKYASLPPTGYSQQATNSIYAANLNRPSQAIKRKNAIIEYNPLHEFKQPCSSQSKSFRTISDNEKHNVTNINNSLYLPSEEQSYSSLLPEQILPNTSLTQHFPCFSQSAINSHSEYPEDITNTPKNESYGDCNIRLINNLNSLDFRSDTVREFNSGCGLSENLSHNHFREPEKKWNSYNQNREHDSPLEGMRPVSKQEMREKSPSTCINRTNVNTPSYGESPPHHISPNSVMNYYKSNSDVDEVPLDSSQSFVNSLKHLNQHTKNTYLCYTITQIEAAHNATCSFVMRNIQVMEELMQSGVENSLNETAAAMWERLKAIINTIVARIVEFSNYVPGFSELDPSDRSSLLNEVVFDMWMIDSSRFLTKGESYLIFEDGIQYSKRWMGHFLSEEMVSKLFEFAEDLNNKKLTFTELAILKAICLCNPDRENIINKESIILLRNHFLDAFNSEVLNNHTHDSGSILLDVGLFFPRLKELHELQAKNIETLKIGP